MPNNFKADGWDIEEDEVQPIMGSDDDDDEDEEDEEEKAAVVAVPGEEPVVAIEEEEEEEEEEEGVDELRELEKLEKRLKKDEIELNVGGEEE